MTPAPDTPTSEWRWITGHAATVLVGQLAVMAFGVTDTVLAGRYAESALAALSVGSAYYISVFVALMGIMQALLPVWAELHGARRQAEVGHSLRQALYLCLTTTAVGTFALLNPSPLPHWASVPAEMHGPVSDYLAILSLALGPALLFRMFSTLNQALGKPRLVTVLQVGALALKIPLSWWLTFGGGGLAAMGLQGCAWATVVVNVGMVGVALVLLRSQDLYRPYAIWRRLEPPDWARLRQYTRLGVPAGLAILVEVTSFTLMALFIARMGQTASAAHQVASNLAAILYMVPLAFAIATSARTSYWLGAAQPQRAQRAAVTGLILGMSLAILFAALTALLREPLALAYTSRPAVAATAATLLGWIALYHCADALQALCVFLLRCYRISVAPLVVYCLLLWGLGLSGGYWLAYIGGGPIAAMGRPEAFWITSAVALLGVSGIFSVMLWHAMRSSRAVRACASHPDP